MKISSKGQVTIPQVFRNRLGLLPYTEVEFKVVEDHVQIRKVVPVSGFSERGRRAIEALRGTSDTGMSTDKIMALTWNWGKE